MSVSVKKAASELIQSKLQQKMAGDKLAGQYLNHKVLKVIYQFSLDLSYSLLFASIGMVVAFDSSERQALVGYCGSTDKKIYLISVIVLATVIVAFKKLSKMKHFGSRCRKYCSLIEDLMRTAVYILLLIVLTPLALGNWNLSSKILQAYSIYLASGVLFLVMRVVKWYYYICGEGKDQYDPWMESQRAEELTKKQKKQVQELVSLLLKEKKQVNAINSPREGDSQMIL